MVSYFTIVLETFRMWFKISQLAPKWPHQPHIISVMKVSLATQALSGTVGNVPNSFCSFGSEETAGTAKFSFMIDKKILD